MRVHAIGRTALLDLLIRDPAVVAAFNEECGAVTDLAMQLGALGERIARHAGLARRADLFDANVVLPSEYESHYATYARAFTEARPALEQRLRGLVFDTWGLEWPWVVYELDQHYGRVLNSLITGDGWTGSFSVPPPAPQRGESGASYLQRVQAALRSDRSGVRVNDARIARDVRVFYRLRLRDPPDSIRSVTKDEGFSSTSNTKRAIDRALTVLTTGVPPFTLRGA